MRSTVIISKRGESYIGTVSGKFGGGFSGAYAGKTIEDVAAFAAQNMISYAQGNKEGGDLMAPAEIMALVPTHLHSIAGR